MHISLDYLQRVILFLLAFVVGGLGIYFFNTQNILGFNFGEDFSSGNFFSEWTIQQNVKIGEGYVKESQVDNAVIGTVLSQISFGNDGIKFQSTPKNIDQLFINSQILVNTDIIDLLQSSSNPEKALETHIAHTEETIYAIDEASRQLTTAAKSFLKESRECLAQKRQGDQKFFKGVQQTNSNLVSEGLDQSLKYAPCYITNRIHANARSFLSQKVTANAYLLQQRKVLLTRNKQLLLEHTDYLEGPILEQLIVLKQKLQQINSLTFDQVDDSFVFAYNPSATSYSRGYAYNLPVYESFVIWPDHIPTYENPGLEEVVNPAENPLLNNPVLRSQTEVENPYYLETP